MVSNQTAAGVGLDDTDTPTKWPKNPEDAVVNEMDTGALINELETLDIVPKNISLNSQEQKVIQKNPEKFMWALYEDVKPHRVQTGTYRGTQLALNKVYDLVEQSYASVMNVTQVEPLFPMPMSMDTKRELFKFTKSDFFPPHLDLFANQPWNAKEKDPNQRSNIKESSIFSWYQLLRLASIMKGTVPWDFKLRSQTPDQGKTIKEVEEYNRNELKRWFKVDVFSRRNVGELKDWYSDARFSQQHFTGTNPTTIETASLFWTDHFILAAKAKDDAAAKDIITELSSSSHESLYIQDYSYFRRSAGLTPAADIQCENQSKKGSYRYGCASVCLFYLNPKGQLYPLAIVIDWRGSLERSVTIYNRELFKRTDIQSGNPKYNPKEEMLDEADDWPWRYAKTCVQVSDWLRHEVTAHLTRTHLVEESIIVAANRCLDPGHDVFKLLRPHWQKTLALNAAARGTLVPSVIIPIIGFKQSEALEFIRNEYRSFDFEKKYVPKDLDARGFPQAELDSEKFHNYAYARCINSMWKKLRAYVEGMLSVAYPGPDADQRDRQVEEDQSIQEWSREMRSPDGADLRYFPVISTFEELVDCVTMCIHLASPQHTAVNYLQDYYQCFVINKPSCLFTKPPTSLDSLLSYTEKDLVEALPINHTHEWLLASNVPYLLNYKPNADKETLIGCICSQWKNYNAKQSPSDKEMKIKNVLFEFYKALQGSDEEFERYARAKDDYNEIKYDVLKTDWNAVSILI